jgi:hypothetical protein
MAATNDDDVVYLIWSFEHNGWWRPGGYKGYTPDFEQAGRFTHDAALAICTKANRYSDTANEAMAPLPATNRLRRRVLTTPTTAATMRTYAPEIERFRGAGLEIGETGLIVECGAVVLIAREAENTWNAIITMPSDPRCQGALDFAALSARRRGRDRARDR